MKDRVPRRASLIVLGAMLLLVIPASSACALATISSVSPSMQPANVTTDVKVMGSAFNAFFTPTVTFGSGIATNNVNVDSGSQLTVNITIAPSAPTGVHTVTVDDGLGSPSSCQGFPGTPPPPLISTTQATNRTRPRTKHFPTT